MSFNARIRTLTALALLLILPEARAGVNIFVTTAGYGGDYGPANYTAIWVEAEDGTYVTSLDAWGSSHYITSIFTWMRKVPDAVDAFTGATRSGHGELNTDWDLTDAAGTAVSYGLYRVIIEMNEDNYPTPAYLDTLPVLVDDSTKTISAPDRPPFSGFTAYYTPGETIPSRPETGVIHKDSGSMCGGGSIFAMAVTFLVTGTHGGIRRRRKNTKENAS